MGMVEYWMKSFLPKPYRCSAPLYSDRPRKNEKLSVNSLLSAFLLFGVGIVISTVVFFSECVFSWWRNKYRDKTRSNIEIRAHRSNWIIRIIRNLIFSKILDVVCILSCIYCTLIVDSHIGLFDTTSYSEVLWQPIGQCLHFPESLGASCILLPHCIYPCQPECPISHRRP